MEAIIIDTKYAKRDVQRIQKAQGEITSAVNQYNKLIAFLADNYSGHAATFLINIIEDKIKGLNKMKTELDDAKRGLNKTIGAVEQANRNIKKAIQG